MTSNMRQTAVAAIAAAKHDLQRVNFKDGHIKDLFGTNVFNEAAQRDGCPSRSSKRCSRPSSKERRSTPPSPTPSPPP